MHFQDTALPSDPRSMGIRNPILSGDPLRPKQDLTIPSRDGKPHVWTHEMAYEPERINNIVLIGFFNNPDLIVRILLPAYPFDGEALIWSEFYQKIRSAPQWSYQAPKETWFNSALRQMMQMRWHGLTVAMDDSILNTPMEQLLRSANLTQFVAALNLTVFEEVMGTVRAVPNFLERAFTIATEKRSNPLDADSATRQVIGLMEAFPGVMDAENIPTSGFGKIVDLGNSHVRAFADGHPANCMIVSGDLIKSFKDGEEIVNTGIDEVHTKKYLAAKIGDGWDALKWFLHPLVVDKVAGLRLIPADPYETGDGITDIMENKWVEGMFHVVDGHKAYQSQIIDYDSKQDRMGFAHSSDNATERAVAAAGGIEDVIAQWDETVAALHATWGGAAVNFETWGDALSRPAVGGSFHEYLLQVQTRPAMPLGVAPVVVLGGGPMRPTAVEKAVAMLLLVKPGDNNTFGCAYLPYNAQNGPATRVGGAVMTKGILIPPQAKHRFIIILRKDITLLMQCIIMARGGRELGITAFGRVVHTEFVIPQVTKSQMDLMFRLGVMLVHPERVFNMPYAKFKSYLSGGSAKFITPPADVIRSKAVYDNNGNVLPNTCLPGGMYFYRPVRAGPTMHPLHVDRGTYYAGDPDVAGRGRRGGPTVGSCAMFGIPSHGNVTAESMEDMVNSMYMVGACGSLRQCGAMFAEPDSGFTWIHKGVEAAWKQAHDLALRVLPPVAGIAGARSTVSSQAATTLKPAKESQIAKKIWHHGLHGVPNTKCWLNDTKIKDAKGKWYSTCNPRGPLARDGADSITKWQNLPRERLPQRMVMVDDTRLASNSRSQ